ncbi:nitrogenase [Hydrococcus rivularis NIES-593]|uniref:Nitrogenase n=1 Tax=Hydrococcus rivularis NIES-593 TaxID=1921803 RepID=A0A1U7HNM3_9CYAN|nr:nitrogenase component 1 [Hydrococcus rivularis]OKH25200.1 nitrogenase [Hydrococcus rivularis NIES-593]
MSKTLKIQQKTQSYVSTTNACKLCKPLGACLAFRGIEGCVPYLHGSQGCATYMRRYIISHFREPIDIASSSLSEKHAVYGGGPNLMKGILNIMDKYGAKIIGVATTCLTETIGDDVPRLLKEFEAEFGDRELPTLVNVSTPSYSGTHMEGFHATVRAVIDQLATGDGKTRRRGEEETGRGGDEHTESKTVNILPGLCSPADTRYLKEILGDFGISGTILPDISETLDAPAQLDYEKIPEGGTPLAAIQGMGSSQATIEFGQVCQRSHSTGGQLLQERFHVPLYSIGMPIGLRECDRFFDVLEEVSGCPTPRKHELERGRLVDAYVDGHKYVFGKRAVVYGEEDLVVGLTAFLAEIGIKPVLCASGGNSGHFQDAIAAVTSDILTETPIVKEGFDFYEISEEIEQLEPDILIGTSKGYPIARKHNIPLIRAGFPIHDRFGSQRILHLGYRGTQTLLDRIINAFIDKKQADSPVGYGYL